MDAAPTSQLGAYRAIGLSYIAGNGNDDFQGVWERLTRAIAGQVKTAGVNCFGICRCIPGVSDGTWEYIAAVEVTANVPVPEGLIELEIPRGEYAIVEADGFKESANAWKKSREALATMSGYESFCGPGGCQCKTDPPFERYAADFDKTKIAICVPVRPS